METTSVLTPSQSKDLSCGKEKLSKEEMTRKFASPFLTPRMGAVKNSGMAASLSIPAGRFFK